MAVSPRGFSDKPFITGATTLLTGANEGRNPAMGALNQTVNRMTGRTGVETLPSLPKLRTLPMVTKTSSEDAQNAVNSISKERKTLAAKQRTIQAQIQQAKFQPMSYNAKALQAEYDALTPKIADLDAQLEVYRKQTGATPYSPLKSVGGMVMKGLASVNQGVANTAAFAEDIIAAPLELISGQELGTMSDKMPLNRFANYVRKTGSGVSDYYQANMEKGGKTAEIAENLGSSVVAAAPQAILAMLTAGGSTAAQGTAALTQASQAALSPGVATTVRQAVGTMAKDPKYWASFAQVVGDGYEDAMADMRARGDTDENSIRTKAALFAIGNGLFNAAVEQGGVQELPGELQAGAPALRSWVESMVDEGKEEVVQGIIERAMRNLTYNAGNPIASVSDSRAVFNPATAGQEFLGGAVAGGILGAAQMGLGRATSALLNRQVRQQAGYDGGDVNYQENVQTPPTQRDTARAGTLPRDVDRDVTFMPGSGHEKTASTVETVVKGYQKAEHHGLILDAVRANLADVASSDPVATLTGMEFQKTASDKRNLRTKVIDFFNSIGNKVTRQDLGEIELNTTGVRDSLSHGYGKLKAATFAALPQILEQGKLIVHNGPYEGHDYDSYIISAPVKVGDETVYVGALVIKDAKQRYKVHEVLTASESGAPLFQTGSTGQGADVPPRSDTPLGASGDAPTTPIVAEDSAGGNTQFTQNGGKNTLPRDIPRGDVEMMPGARTSKDAGSDAGTIPNAGPNAESSVGAAQKGFAGAYNDLQNQTSASGFHADGENAYRQVDVPMKDFDGKNISKSAATVMEARAIPDDVVADIQQMVADGVFSYNRITDAESTQRAESTIRTIGYDGAVERYHNAARDGRVSKDLMALGATLLNNAANSRNEKVLSQVLADYAAMSRTAAQATQANRLLKKMSPEWQLMTIQRAVDDLNETQAKRQERKRKGGKSAKTENVDADVARVWKEQRDEALDIIRTMSDEYRQDADAAQTEQQGGTRTWVETLGDELASAAARRVSDKTASQSTVYQTIESDLQAFMHQYVDQRKADSRKRTPAERLADYFANRDEYNRAWKRAQEQLQNRYQGDEVMSSRLEEFIQNYPQYNAVGTDGVMMRAVADAVKAEDISRKRMTLRHDYDMDAMVNTVSNRLIRETGASGADQTAIRDAARRYINEQVLNTAKGSSDFIAGDVKKAMSDAKLKLTDIISQSRGTRQEIAQRIADMLVTDYGISEENSQTVADQVTRQFEDLVAESARKRVENLYKEHPKKEKTALQRFEELANMGAFSGDYAEQATSRAMGTEGITIDQELMNRFLQATDQDARDAVMEEIYQNVADQVPSTWKDKWNAWRYMSMLTNPRTHVRNVIGNLGFQPVRWTKDKIGAALEAAAQKSGVEFERTKSFKTDSAMRQAAKKDFANVIEAMSGSKFSDAKSQIQDRRSIFKHKTLEAIRTFNSDKLSAEDMAFKQMTYADSLAGYLMANGVTAEQFTSGNVDQALLLRARDYAVSEAMRATYNDHNAVSDYVSSLGSQAKRSSNFAVRAAGEVGEGVLPFKRTPTNILVRGFEYSPAGLIKSLTADRAKVKRGEMNVSQMLDNAAAGLTGTALLALGVFLKNIGWLTTGGGDDEKQDQLDELSGGQNYAINLPGGGSVTVDWLAPEVLPMFMGAELADALDNEGLHVPSLTKLFTATMEPMLEMSMLQSLNDLIDSVSYFDSGDKLYGLVGSALTSYITQAVPSILGAAERTSEDKRMTTYIDKGSFLPTNVQRTLGKASARFPVLDFQQIPYIDAWGREESTGSVGERAINNFLNPAYTSQKNVTAADEEVQRLYTATGDTSVVPQRPKNEITVDKKKVYLNSDQYLTYAKTRGKTQYDIVSALAKNKGYQNLSDTEKAEVISQAYKYADAVGKHAAVSAYEVDGWVSDATDAKKKWNVSTADYLLMYGELKAATSNEKFDEDDSGSLSAVEKKKAIESLPKDHQQLAWLMAYPEWPEKAAERGVSTADYIKYKSATAGLKKKDEKIQALRDSGMSAEDARALYRDMTKSLKDGKDD